MFKVGDRVRVKLLAKVKPEFQGRAGTVVSDSEPGEVLLVSFDGETEDIAHQFLAEDLESI
jgi:ribosomal protein L21E